MKEEFVNQHIVPKRYLDRFAESQNKKRIIGTRTITKDGNIRFFKQSTTDVGYIKNFYDVTDKSDPKYWEHFLADKIDSLCGKHLERIVSSITLAGKEFSLSNEDKSILSIIIIAQMLRIPKNLNYLMRNIYPKISTDTKSKIYSTFSKDTIKKYKSKIDNYQMPDQEIKEIYLNTVFSNDNLNRFAKILEQRIWIILVNSIRKDLPFITSDNPVLIENLDNGEKSNLLKSGLLNPNVGIYFPITPSIAILYYPTNSILSISQNELNGKIFQITEAKYIITKNIHVMKNAHIHSFIPQPLFDKINKNKDSCL